MCGLSQSVCGRSIHESTPECGSLGCVNNPYDQSISPCDTCDLIRLRHGEVMISHSSTSCFEYSNTNDCTFPIPHALTLGGVYANQSATCDSYIHWINYEYASNRTCWPLPPPSRHEETVAFQLEIVPLNTSEMSDLDNDGILETGDMNADGVINFSDNPLVVECDVEGPDASESAGAIIFASTHDSDADGIPDYADGYNLYDHLPVHPIPDRIKPQVAKDIDTRSPHRRNLRKVTIQVGGLILPELKPDGTPFPEQTITFHYAGSDPYAVQVSSDGSYMLPPTGSLRLWMPTSETIPTDPPPQTPTDPAYWQAVMNGWGMAGDAEAQPQNCYIFDTASREQLDGGNATYIVPEHPYTLSSLGITRANTTITAYLEATDISPSLGMDILVSVSTSGYQPAPIVQGRPSSSSTVKVTAVDWTYRAIRPDGTIDTNNKVDQLPISVSNPVIEPGSNDGLTISNLRVSSDNQRLLATITVVGTIDDAFCDITPGEAGTIEEIKVSINEHSMDSISDEAPTCIAVTYTKNTDSTGPGGNTTNKRFNYSGQYAYVFQEVEVTSGFNTLVVAAHNSQGAIGDIVYTFQVALQPPQNLPEEQIDYAGYSPSLGYSEVTTISSMGLMNLVTIDFLGPTGIHEHVKYIDLSVGSQVQRLVITPNPDGSLRLVDPATLLPAWLTSAPDVMSMEELNQHFAERYLKDDRWDGTAAFFAGYGVGLWDAGSSAVTGVWDMGKSVVCFAGHYIANYNFVSVGIRLYNNEGVLLAEDQQKLESAWKTTQDAAKLAGDLLMRLAQHEQDIFEYIMTGNEQALAGLNSDWKKAVQMASEILDALSEHLDSLDDYEAGKLSGRIIGEVALIVVPALFSGGTTAVVQAASYAEKLAIVLDKCGKAGKAGGYLARAFGKGLTTVGQLQSEIQVLKDSVAARAVSKLCFVAGTLVVTQSGLTPIECIQPGELVLSQDELTHQQDFKPVVRTITTHPTELYTMVYTSPDGEAVEIVGTGNHPVYVLRTNRFVPIADVRDGDSLLLSSGQQATVQAVRLSATSTLDQPFTTYNLEVEDFHTYFVGTSGVWVHNEGREFCTRMAGLFEKFMVRRNGDVWDGYSYALERLDGMAVADPRLGRDGVARLQFLNEARRRWVSNPGTATPPLWRTVAQQTFEPPSVPPGSNYYNTQMAQRLKQNMRTVFNVDRVDGCDAHHIVPHSGDTPDGALTQVRQLLSQHNVHLNEAANGAYIPSNLPTSRDFPSLGPSHPTVNTNAYKSALRDRLLALPSPNGDKIRDELQRIASELIDGTFP